MNQENTSKGKKLADQVQQSMKQERQRIKQLADQRKDEAIQKGAKIVKWVGIAGALVLVVWGARYIFRAVGGTVKAFREMVSDVKG